MHAAGIVVATVGALLAARIALLLSGRGRPQRGPRPPFVLAGPYRYLRNPLFGGLVLAAAGTALATRSWGLAVGVALAGGAAHLWVVRVEEPRLRARFGTAYLEYLRAVPRWLPHLRRPADD